MIEIGPSKVGEPCSMPCRLWKEVWLWPCRVRARGARRRKKKQKGSQATLIEKNMGGGGSICAPRANTGLNQPYTFLPQLDSEHELIL